MLKKTLIGLVLFITQHCWAVDVFDGNYLKIENVQVGDSIYSGVNITIKEVISVNGGIADKSYDTYSPATNQLQIPLVTVGSNIYTNVIVTVGNVISVQKSMPLSSLYFEEVIDGFPDLTKYARNLNDKFMATNIAVIDFNKDGRNDLLVHMYRFWDPVTDSDINKSTPNLLIALVQNKDGKFEDKTLNIFGQEFVDPAGSASRKVRVADINGDGFLDAVYALNKEDGRPWTGNNWNSLSVAVMSKGDGTYKVQKFGLNTYHHSVEIVDDLTHGKVVLFEGPTQNAYTYKNNEFIELNSWPILNAGTFLGYKSNNRNDTNKIITQTGYPVASLLLYAKDTIGKWIELATWKFEKTRTVQIGTSTLDQTSKIAYTYEGKEFLDNGFGGLYESCSLRLNPRDELIPVIHWTPSTLPSDSQKKLVFSWNDIGMPTSVLLAFKESYGTLIEQDIFQNKQNQENINFINCKDFNNDGYDDLSQHPYRNGARPILHINNKNGKLIKIDENKFPLGPNKESWTSMFIDNLEKNTSDLIYFSANGCQFNYLNCNRFKLWKNIKKLDT
jgi:hypothetical protein